MKHAVGLAALVCALVTGGSAIAQPNAPGDIVARAHSQRLGWITTQGPDAAGRYAVAVDVSGIDPTTQAGWTRMARRAAHGVNELCDVAGAKTFVLGTRDAVRESCLDEGRNSALSQMQQARDAARRGVEVSSLGVSFGG